MLKIYYFEWECTKCGECICKATTAKHPDSYVNSHEKHTYSCRNGFNAEWIPVQTHVRDMEAVRACIQ